MFQVNASTSRQSPSARNKLAAAAVSCAFNAALKPSQRRASAWAVVCFLSTTFIITLFLALLRQLCFQQIKRFHCFARRQVVGVKRDESSGHGILDRLLRILRQFGGDRKQWQVFKTFRRG